MCTQNVRVISFYLDKLLGKSVKAKKTTRNYRTPDWTSTLLEIFAVYVCVRVRANIETLTLNRVLSYLIFRCNIVKAWQFKAQHKPIRSG